MANANGETERGKSCFVIGPIGDAASAVRSRSDKVFNHVIRPAAEECGYLEIIRSDMDSRPGLINSQVITHSFA